MLGGTGGDGVGISAGRYRRIWPLLEILNLLARTPEFYFFSSSLDVFVYAESVYICVYLSAAENQAKTE